MRGVGAGAPPPPAGTPTIALQAMHRLVGENRPQQRIFDTEQDFSSYMNSALAIPQIRWVGGFQHWIPRVAVATDRHVSAC